MKITNYIIATIILLATTIELNTYGQNHREKEAIADKMIAEQQYTEANTIYLSILAKDSTNNRIRSKYANSNRLQGQNKTAFEEYKKIIDSKGNIPINTYYYYGETANNTGNYKEAIYGYSQYIKLGKNAKLRRLAEQKLISSKYALSNSSDSSKVEIIHLPPPINTEYSEFNAIQFSTNKMVFSRYQAQFSDSIDNVFSQNYISDIYTTKQSISGWTKARIFSEKLSSNKYFTANASFSKNKREVYFTRCIDNGGQIGRCMIYHSKYSKGKWSRPKKIDKLDNTDYTYTQPNITEFEDYKILYFSSNIPNGFGGNDIWYSVIRNNKIAEPQNAGSIVNTFGDELTPYYDSETQNLYFSSNAHKGYGGFDIFKVSGALSSFTQLKNMGKEINSPLNDLYYIKGIDDGTAFFSSNRKGSFYHGSQENCCTDIYMIQQIEEKEIPLEEIVTDSIEQDSVVLAINKLLPLSLYFENDMPDRKSLKTSTNTNYKDLLKEYLKAKNIYKEEYAKGLKGEEAEIAKQQIEDFFDKKLETGFENLNRFAELLKTELGKEKHVRIKIIGLASPLNSPEYNLALSKRRISSLKNYIKEYDNGYFAQYINNTNDSINRLSIYEDPLGDSQSIGLVSNNANDKRNSVYSREAALQRKIQIVMYSSNGSFDQNNKAYPILKWKNKSINIGGIDKGDKKSFIVYFANNGESELVIKSIEANCNCIQIQNPKQAIQNGEQSLFYVLINTKDLATGKYKKIISVYTNEYSEKSEILLEFIIN